MIDVRYPRCSEVHRVHCNPGKGVVPYDVDVVDFRCRCGLPIEFDADKVVGDACRRAASHGSLSHECGSRGAAPPDIALLERRKPTIASAFLPAAHAHETCHEHET